MLSIGKWNLFECYWMYTKPNIIIYPAVLFEDNRGEQIFYTRIAERKTPKQ